ncbi:hypothetical protein ACROYT_G022136 [Oculina patagonica]
MLNNLHLSCGERMSHNEHPSSVMRSNTPCNTINSRTWHYKCRMQVVDIFTKHLGPEGIFQKLKKYLANMNVPRLTAIVITYDKCKTEVSKYTNRKAVQTNVLRLYSTLNASK